MKYLYSQPQKDYVLQETPYEEQIRRAASMIQNADKILIGGGAGLSTAAGLDFGGKRFTDNFSDFIEKYGSKYMTDMFHGGFYPFETEEEYWAYWSRHVYINRINIDALPTYKRLYEIVKDKEYFVLTTNADSQFAKAGFADEKIFATQGDYSLIQCSRACHGKTYNAMDMFEDMKDNIEDCKIPSNMVLKCPVCGGAMEMNLRNDHYFIEDKFWNNAEANYGQFVENIGQGKIVLIELGIGFNTPMIIRFPFEKIVKDMDNAYLIRLNLDDAMVPNIFGDRAIGIKEDIAKIIEDIYNLCVEK